MNWPVCAPRMKVIQFEMSQISQVQLQFPVNKLVWNIHNNSNSTDFSQPLYENKWIKSNNSYLWMCITEYSQPRHDIIAFQRTKLCPNHVRRQYTSTRAPPTTLKRSYASPVTLRRLRPAALTWPFARSANEATASFAIRSRIANEAIASFAIHSTVL